MFDGLVDPVELRKAKQREYMREYNAKNREKIRERKRDYYGANRGEILEKKHDHYVANLEKNREKFREYYTKNREEILGKQRAYRVTNIRRVLVGAARRRAQERGEGFTITVEDIRWPTHCPVLGIKLNYEGGKGPNAPDSPSLDRWDNSDIYRPGNVFVISYRANLLKNNGDWRELRAVAAYAEYGIAPEGLEEIWGC